jgi:hypothetical protein
MKTIDIKIILCYIFWKITKEGIIFEIKLCKHNYFANKTIRRLQMYFDGIIIGFFAFLIMGLFHPLIVHGEYHFGIKIWLLFLCFGIIFCIASIIIKNTIISVMMGIAGFTSFWSIFEVFKQKKRVDKGWFPKKK